MKSKKEFVFEAVQRILGGDDLHTVFTELNISEGRDRDAILNQVVYIILLKF